MRAWMDLHTHTISSGHAYSTLKENIEQAQAVGLTVLGTSDHAMEMPGSAHRMFFENYKVIPDKIGDLRLLGGVEANIMDYQGRLDVGEKLLQKMDYVIASLHPVCITPGNREENTQAILCVMDNPYVKIIGHPDDDRFPLDLERIAKKAADKKVALELNNSSLHPKAARVNADKNIPHLLRCAKEYGASILMGTDSHICYQVGDFQMAERMLAAVDFPQELVINYYPERLGEVLTQTGRERVGI